MLGCSSLTLSILAECASMVLQLNMMTTLYGPSIQEHSSLFVSKQSKSSRTVHDTSIKCRSSNTRFIHLGSATPLQSQSGSKWKSFEMPYQILEVQIPNLSVVILKNKGSVYQRAMPAHARPYDKITQPVK